MRYCATCEGIVARSPSGREMRPPCFWTGDKSTTFSFHKGFIDFNYRRSADICWSLRIRLLDLESFKVASIRRIVLRIWLLDSFRKWIINGETRLQLDPATNDFYRDYVLRINSIIMTLCLGTVLIRPIPGVDIFFTLTDYSARLN